MMIPRNPLRDIAAVASIVVIATGAFIEYVKWYERKHGSSNKK